MPLGRYAATMADLQKRIGYTPRRARERRAYQLTMTGGIAGAVGVVSLVLALVGVIGYALPVVSIIVAIICLVMFQRAVGTR